MRVSMYQVDAFTDRPFAGNPAAVCLLGAWLPDATMAAVAAENNVSETAFVVPRPDGDHDLRWFTPSVEVPLCGHATLATAHVLLDEPGTVVFHTRSGPLRVDRRSDGRLDLDLPALGAGDELDDHPLRAAVVDGLGRTPLALRHVRQTPAARVLLAEYATEADVAALDAPRIDGINVMATAPADDAAIDVVSRYFAWASGVVEDPVTGSAHCTLVPFWCGRLGRGDLRARQISARGGDLWCRWDGGDRVGIGGHAVTVLHGELILPDATTPGGTGSD